MKTVMPALVNVKTKVVAVVEAMHLPFEYVIARDDFVFPACIGMPNCETQRFRFDDLAAFGNVEQIFNRDWGHMETPLFLMHHEP